MDPPIYDENSIHFQPLVPPIFNLGYQKNLQQMSPSITSF